MGKFLMWGAVLSFLLSCAAVFLDIVRCGAWVGMMNQSSCSDPSRFGPNGSGFFIRLFWLFVLAAMLRKLLRSFARPQKSAK